MGKISEFYKKVLTNQAALNELIVILDGRKVEKASDEQLAKIGALAKRFGFDITIEEAKDYLNSSEAEFDEDELDAVAGGGKGDGN